MTGQQGQAPTVNTVHGADGAVVQAGAIHGDVILSTDHQKTPVPRQLPLSPCGFVDRAEHIRHLDVLAGETGGGVPIVVVSGPPGVGKSALVAHWAHRMRDRFPDGDLYAHMHGHAPGPRTEAAHVLDSFLRALGTSTDRIPLDLDSRASLFRSVLDDKRVLVIIDDAITAFREAWERRGEAMCLLSLAEFAADTERFEEALDRAREAVEVFTGIGNVWSVAWARCTLGRVLSDMGRFDEALTAYRAAEEVFAGHGDQDSRTVALLGLGDVHAQLGDPVRAREALGAALDYLRDHGDPRADQVAQRLTTLGPRAEAYHGRRPLRSGSGAGGDVSTTSGRYQTLRHFGTQAPSSTA